MAANTTISGLPYPELGDEPNIENAVKPLAEAIDDKVNVRFSTTSERDGAIPTPVTGQECYVTGVGKQIYTGTEWRVIATAQVYTGSSSGTTSSTGVITVTHGLGFTPDAVTVIPSNPTGEFGQLWGVDNLTTTQFRVRFATANGGTLVSTSVSFRWVAFRTS